MERPVCAHVEAGTGVACIKLVDYGHLCSTHLASVMQLAVVDTSVIPGAGAGLVTLRDVKKGKRVVEYVGRHLEPDGKGGPYAVQLSSSWMIDGADRYAGGYGRLVNCCRTANKIAGHAPRGNNLAFSVDHRNKRVYLVATRRIASGEELLVPYGPAYKWKG
jgi:SET domain-containing protein